MSLDESGVPRLGNSAVVHHACDRAADVREDDHVVLLPEVPLAELHVAEVGVGDAVGVERGPHPPFILGAGPAVDVADARDVQIVRLHVRSRCHGIRRQAELLERRLQRGPLGVPDDERPGAEVVPLGVEVLLRRFHLHLREPEPESRDVVVGRVVHHHYIPRAGDPARGDRIPGEQRHRLGEKGAVLHRRDRDVAHEGECPTGVVVRGRVAR